MKIKLLIFFLSDFLLNLYQVMLKSYQLMAGQNSFSRYLESRLLFLFTGRLYCAILFYLWLYP